MESGHIVQPTYPRLCASYFVNVSLSVLYLRLSTILSASYSLSLHGFLTMDFQNINPNNETYSHWILNINLEGGSVAVMDILEYCSIIQREPHRGLLRSLHHRHAKIVKDNILVEMKANIYQQQYYHSVLSLTSKYSSRLVAVTTKRHYVIFLQSFFFAIYLSSSKYNNLLR